MTCQTSAADAMAVLDGVRDLHAEDDAARLPGHLLRTPRRLIPCRLAGFTRVDPVLAESTVHLAPRADAGLDGSRSGSSFGPVP